MLLPAVCFLGFRFLVRTFLHACFALLLLFATYNSSSANDLLISSNEPLVQPATPASTSCLDKTAAGGVQACSEGEAPPVFVNTSSSSERSATMPAAITSTDLLVNKSIDDNRTPDWEGVWRDTGILIGSQVVAAGIIYVMPESFSSWSSEQKKNSFKKYAKNVSNPVIDKDSLYINYILHPYWGATYYIRARERGFDKFPSFMYSTLISAMYELGVECFFEKPSIQDLIVTPVAGSLVGALIFEPWRESIKRKPELRWYDHAALVATDPVGFLSLGFEKMFGIKSTIMVDYSVPQIQKRSTGSVVASKSNRIGIVMQFPFE